jgi:transglutaminase-like putative cysteine protease
VGRDPIVRSAALASSGYPSHVQQAPTPQTLAPTWYLDFDAEPVRDFVADAVGGVIDPVEQAQRLFYAVRDGTRYDPYTFRLVKEDYKASSVLGLEGTFCVPKAVLLAAAARAAGIPARLGFADVRNHLASDKLLALLGTDLFAFHGFAVLLLDGKWVKATPAFNASMCERFGVLPLEFDGRTDALFHRFDAAGRQHMEYVRDRGLHDDFPYDYMLEVLAEVYGPQMAGKLDSAGTDEAFHG